MLRDIFFAFTFCTAFVLLLIVVQVQSSAALAILVPVSTVIAALSTRTKPQTGDSRPGIWIGVVRSTTLIVVFMAVPLAAAVWTMGSGLASTGIGGGPSLGITATLLLSLVAVVFGIAPLLYLIRKHFG
jgi:hypothetical protein